MSRKSAARAAALGLISEPTPGPPIHVSLKCKDAERPRAWPKDHPAADDEAVEEDLDATAGNSLAEKYWERPRGHVAADPPTPPIPPIDSPFADGIQMSFGQEIVFVGVIAFCQLLTQASLGQVITPLNIIGQTLGTTSPGQLSWFCAAYSLTVGIFVLPSGRLGDLYGHRRMLIIGFIWFSLTSVLCGVTVYTRSPIVFDVARALQGIGPAIVLPNGVAILGRTYKPGPRKNYAFALFAATAPNGFILGSLFGSLFAQLASWPWAFYTEAIIIAFLAQTIFIVVPQDAPRPRRQPSFDWIGTILGISSLVLFNFSWNQAPVVGWQTPYVYFLLIISLILLVAFLYIESRVKDALVPLDIWTRPTTFMCGCIALGWSSFGIWSYYLMRLWIDLRGQTPLSATANFLPAGLSGIVASFATGHLLHRLGPPLAMIIAMFAFCLANILLASAPVNQAYWAQTFVSVLIAPFGMDISYPSASILASNSVPPHQQGIAASLINTVVNFSISTGLGIAGTVDAQVSRNGTDVLRGHHGAEYLGIGLSFLGIVVALTNFIIDRRSGGQGSKIPTGAAV